MQYACEKDQQGAHFIFFVCFNYTVQMVKFTVSWDVALNSSQKRGHSFSTLQHHNPKEYHLNSET
jgi:hypothetical protein